MNDAIRVARKAIRHPKKAVMQVKRNWPLLIELAKTRDYSEAYRRHQNSRMKVAPKKSVGGWGDGIGKLQFEFMTDIGLKPEHRLLDVGCGTLRAGRYFIDYLDGGYVGMDISETALLEGESLLDDDVADSEYRLVSNHDLRFREFGRNRFDFALAQSVLTHIPAGDVSQCLRNLPRVMKDGGRVYATINEPDDSVGYEIAGLRTYRYTVDYLQKLAGDLWMIDTISESEYPHPRGQKMIELRLGGSQ